MKNKKGAKMKGEFIVKYNNRDIIDKLDSMEDKIDKIHAQTIRINGTVASHTKQITSQKTLIYGCYAFVVTVVGVALMIAL